MSSTSTAKLLFVFCLTVGLAFAAAQDVVHAVGGTVTKVDSATKTLAVKTAEGTEETFKYGDKTVVKSAKGAGKGSKAAGVDGYLAGKKGTHAVVHYTGKGTDKMAVGLEDFGKGTFKVSRGTVTDVGKGGRFLAVKTDKGTVETFDVSKTAVVDSEHGVVKASEYSAKEGEKVTVHYTEDAGKKVAHLVKQL